MPIKYTNTAKALKIEWANEDASQTASFSVPKQASETDQVKALLKAVGFLATQTGVIPAAAPSTPTMTTPAATAPTAPTATGLPSGSPASSGPRVQMMSPASLSDLPAGGLPPKGEVDWAQMPTTTVPQHLTGAWETIPPDEQGGWE